MHIVIIRQGSHVAYLHNHLELLLHEMATNSCSSADQLFYCYPVYYIQVFNWELSRSNDCST